MKITFYGACGEVTGSNYLIETKSGKKIILECGLFQGKKESEEKNFREFVYSSSEIDAVIISHSHLDHIGLLPKLYAHGFVGKIFSTRPTADFADIFLQDAQRIQEANLETKEKFGILYSMSDVLSITKHFQAKEYYEEFEVCEGVKCKFYDAGHILGSAIVEITADGKKFVFTGDLGNPPVPILRDTDEISSADVVMMESTYGKRLHMPTKERSKILKDLIINTAKSNGTLLIPAFALERTQEILYEINEMIENNLIPKIPIYLDSPLAIKATKIYPKYSEYFDKNAKRILKKDENLFDFSNLIICETANQSKQIRHQFGPKVIIAGSGMSTGGRILYHERDFLADPKTTVAIVGFQVEGTLGRDLVEGKRQVKILGDHINVNARIISIDSYSAHADYNGLKNWLSKIKNVKKVILVHGEQQARINLKNVIKSEIDNSLEVILPEENESIQI